VAARASTRSHRGDGRSPVSLGRASCGRRGLLYGGARPRCSSDRRVGCAPTCRVGESVVRTRGVELGF
jgi:hypothetical protein